ncbi:MAG: FAD-binding oxidoreductase [Anaerolineales bacterium]|jgi:D-lactate dehydrogenase (cytochrome)
MSDPREELTPDALAFLASVVGEKHVSRKVADLDQHARDQSFHQPHRPAVVVWPSSADEISAILAYANQRRIPVTPWGAGTSLEGNPIPIHGGISLDTLRMDEILEVRAEDFQVDVQAGVRFQSLNERLARQGLFFPPDPGADASIGGMIANNAAGTRSLRYGTTKDNVLRLQVVLPSGDIIRAGSRVAKTASGYDLVHLFIGSEGTLGVVTEATLRLTPLLERFSAVIASFPTLEQAARTVSSVMGSGLVPAALEFLDPASLRDMNAAGDFQLPEEPTLLMEFHSATEVGLKEELSVVETLCSDEGCLTFETGLGRQERDRLWRVRHQMYETLVRANPGRAFLVVDVAVPVSQYAELVGAAQHAMTSRGLRGYLAGHAGDGNLHPLVPYTPGDAESHALALAADHEVVETAIAMGGTATAEHGVGIGKRRFMDLEHGESLAVMRAIKTALDPNGILNPGKIF